MSISFYEASVETYIRILDSLANVLDKGAAFAEENGRDTADFVHTRLCEDMMPPHFQVVSTCHQSWGALQEYARRQICASVL